MNGKVSFLEKFGNSEIKTSTGAYELDLSLVNDPGRAWRIMHTKSNTWCSAAVVLPDKAARILNVAGWSNDAAYGLRFYTPDGSPGVNGINDWEENPHNLKLQVPINPTLEIIPRIPGGQTQVHLDYLQRTAPNNLYPYLHVLPSGRIFIGEFETTDFSNFPH